MRRETFFFVFVFVLETIIFLNMFFRRSTTHTHS
jgi:hypothetical protein